MKTSLAWWPSPSLAHTRPLACTQLYRTGCCSCGFVGILAEFDAVMMGPFLPARCIEAPVFSTRRRRAMLRYCKWDAQIGDIATLCPFPLVLEPHAWTLLAHAAEA